VFKKQLRTSSALSSLSDNVDTASVVKKTKNWYFGCRNSTCMRLMKNVSLKALFLCYALMALTAFVYYPRWENSRTEATLSWDVSGYYLYLPAFFIYHDLNHCAFADSLIRKYYPTPDYQQAFKHEPSGNMVMKYAMGQAVSMTPFFLLGHAWASMSDTYPPDGFSFPYQFSIGAGMFLYALLGLFLLRRLLRRFFSDWAVALVLIGLVFGSNYLNYSSVDQAMTHSPLFTIYTLLLTAVLYFYDRPGWGSACAIGGLCGLATLTRPTEIISLLIPLAWGLYSWSDMRGRLVFLGKHWRLVLGAAFCFVAVAGLQPLYWKSVTGEWLVYSYQDQGFDWLHPHIGDFTFSYKCGWLRYSPMLLFAVAGLWAFTRRREHTWAVMGYLLLHFYITTAWSIWDYGGTAGRAMIQSYPVLAFPLAALIDRLPEKKWYGRVFYPLYVLFIYLNIWWTHNAHRGHVQVLDVTRPYYWRTVGRWSITENDRKLLDTRYSFASEPVEPRMLYENSFETDTSKNAVQTPDGRKIRVGGPLEFSPEFNVFKSDAVKKWVRVYADIHCRDKEWDIWKQQMFTLRFHLGDQTVATYALRVPRYFTTGEKKQLYLDAKVPRKDWDRMAIHFWSAGSSREIDIDNLRVVTFEE
jgi:hypothetical protein